MLICGLQKLSLVDYPDKLAATIFTGGCNYRCPFCHNAPLVTELASAQEINDDEVLEFLKTRRGLLDGICLSGGEPLMQKDVAEFLTKVRELGFSIKLDTNGSFPDKLISLVGAGLVDYVAMDIKNSLAMYAKTVGVESVDLLSIRRSAQFLMSGTVEYEFRTTLVRELHDEQSLRELGEWLRGAKRLFLQNFVDSGNLIEQGLHGFSKQGMQQLRQVVAPFFDDVYLRGV